MKNVLLKNNLMSQGKISKTLVNIPNRGFLEYNYQFTKALSQDRIHYNEIYFNKSMPTDSTVLNYKGVRFNMIACPAGGEVNIEEWGVQEIKEPSMLSETEVTQELFEAAMEFNYSNFKKSNKNPVENVTWYDCLEFCNRLSGYFGFGNRYVLSDKKFTNNDYPLSIEDANVTFVEWANGFCLPKEWEWQIAAMAGTSNLYAGANDDESLKRVAWFKDNSGRLLDGEIVDQKTHPVAQKMPNEWGFYDMSGNVLEWCENAIPSFQIAINVRGGCYSSDASNVRSAFCLYYYNMVRGSNIGFRIARSI